MARYETTTAVDADLETVWAFHDDVEGLVDLTPSWMRPEVRFLEQPDENLLAEGTVFELLVRPLGVGHCSRIVSRIDERRVDSDRALLVDTMIDGPFPEWSHRHVLTADGDVTRIVDEIRYRNPPIGRGTGLATPYILGGLFRYRHRQLRDRFGRVDR